MVEVDEVGFDIVYHLSLGRLEVWVHLFNEQIEEMVINQTDHLDDEVVHDEAEGTEPHHVIIDMVE